ncbi:MAG: hypothetical protein IJC75_05320 [Oscillospiraceae bacterium]|nr:hypothetical protein [Oscillospiraceae bacterium]
MIKRIWGSISLAFHAGAEVIFAGVILRMLLSVIEVFQTGASTSIFIALREDRYSLLILPCMGFFICRRHVGLSTAMQFSPAVRVTGFAVISAVVSAVFAVADVAMVKLYYNVLAESSRSRWDEADCVRTFLESYVFMDRGEAPAFSLNGTLLLLNTAVLYFGLMLCGYLLRYMLHTHPKMLVLWLVAVAAAAGWLFAMEHLPTGVAVISFLVIGILLLCTLCPVIFLFGGTILCCC